MGLTVDLAFSTSAGVKRFKQGHYSLIISDMGRRENKFFNHTAGLDLLKEIRAIDENVQFVFFTTSENVSKYWSKAEELGVTFMASSWGQIVSLIYQ
jgi:DNA-binding NtrC family response regulator